MRNGNAPPHNAFSVIYMLCVDKNLPVYEMIVKPSLPGAPADVRRATPLKRRLAYDQRAAEALGVGAVPVGSTTSLERLHQTGLRRA